MKIAFTASNKWGARLIRWFTKSQWSHVLIITDDDLEGEALVFESALHGGVKLNFWSNHAKEKHQVFDINITVSIKPMYKYLGKNYGYLQILGFAIAKLLRLKKNPIGQNYVCSEVVLLLLAKSSLAKEFENLKFNNTTPENLYKVIKDSANFQLIKEN